MAIETGRGAPGANTGRVPGRRLVRTHRSRTDERRRARRSGHYRETVLSGAFGGGMLGAGLGPLGAVGGMILGGAAGYLVERRAERRSSDKTPA